LIERAAPPSTFFADENCQPIVVPVIADGGGKERRQFQVLLKISVQNPVEFLGFSERFAGVLRLAALGVGNATEQEGTEEQNL
jgi:hypothetical protein